MNIIIPEITEIVNFYTPENIEEIAKATEFVRRESKLGGIEFLILMTQGLYAKPDATLSQMAGMLKDINPRLEISKTGIQLRIVNGVGFLKQLLSEALQISSSRSLSSDIPELLKSFEKAHLLDSTQISLPEELSHRWSGSGGSASKAGMKLHLQLDYKSGQYEKITIEEGKSADQSYIKEAVNLIGKGELLIYDPGYFGTNSMIDLSERGAYFLSRFNHRAGLYTKKEDSSFEKFDLEEELKEAGEQGEKFVEFQVWLNKDGRELQIRLISELASEEVANQRRCKARKTAKKKGRKPTRKHLYLMNWSLYITNAEPEKPASESVSVVYGLRWYIELVFKTWKSYHGLSQIRGEREERIECFIYGRLIMIVIMAFLFNSIQRHLWNTRRREASLLKVISHFQVKSLKALIVMTDSESFAKFLLTEFFEACRLCVMDSRKRLSTAQKMRGAKSA
jgi:hypothetical protein